MTAIERTEVPRPGNENCRSISDPSSYEGYELDAQKYTPGTRDELFAFGYLKYAPGYNVVAYNRHNTKLLACLGTEI